MGKEDLVTHLEILRAERNSVKERFHVLVYQVRSEYDVFEDEL